MVAIDSAKQAMRSSVRKILRGLPADELAKASVAACKRASELEAVVRGVGVSVYLAMPAAECQTEALLRSLFEQSNKSIFVPRVDGMDRNEMRMLRVVCLQQLESFPRSKWGIPEPTEEEAIGLENGLEAAQIDTVIVPAVAFDRRCHRLGQGRGYYGGNWLPSMSSCPIPLPRIPSRPSLAHPIPSKPTMQILSSRSSRTHAPLEA